jgi:Tat protein secretion system quality control protein TatD with DNase activity
MKYIDIHCHLDFPDYGTEISDVLARMRESNVGAITIGTDLESSKSAVKIAEENENILKKIILHSSQNQHLMWQKKLILSYINLTCLTKNLTLMRVRLSWNMFLKINMHSSDQEDSD